MEIKGCVDWLGEHVILSNDILKASYLHFVGNMPSFNGLFIYFYFIFYLDYLRGLVSSN